MMGHGGVGVSRIGKHRSCRRPRKGDGGAPAGVVLVANEAGRHVLPVNKRLAFPSRAGDGITKLFDQGLLNWHGCGASKGAAGLQISSTSQCHAVKMRVEGRPPAANERAEKRLRSFCNAHCMRSCGTVYRTVVRMGFAPPVKQDGTGGL